MGTTQTELRVLRVRMLCQRLRPEPVYSGRKVCVCSFAAAGSASDKGGGGASGWKVIRDDSSANRSMNCFSLERSNARFRTDANGMDGLLKNTRGVSPKVGHTKFTENKWTHQIFSRWKTQKNQMKKNQMNLMLSKSRKFKASKFIKLHVTQKIIIFCVSLFSRELFSVNYLDWRSIHS